MAAFAHSMMILLPGQGAPFVLDATSWALIAIKSDGWDDCSVTRGHEEPRTHLPGRKLAAIAPTALRESFQRECDITAPRL